MEQHFVEIAANCLFASFELSGLYFLLSVWPVVYALSSVAT